MMNIYTTQLLEVLDYIGPILDGGKQTDVVDLFGHVQGIRQSPP